ncbi:hypothetical protein E0E50_01475 [Azotobacter chroococcum subsp. isscasi]|uniref:hypothetical protein n=1 Tax=Azotobacter chroococcum TaxID=353 RepID=UPI001039B02F|nr:hypothetical protein [Azotobacter chroococcum]TBW12966.1 hypothetical protein E0E50_01475 [Azotobacter chroococcum subsp. isscasi]
MQTITLGISVKASKTSISIPESDIKVEATDYLEVEVSPGGLDVDIQPGKAEAIRLLVIKSSVYSDLEFTVNDGAGDSSAIVQLDGPQIFSGGAMALFDVAQPKRLTFTNKSQDTAAKVEIFVGRDATP